MIKIYSSKFSIMFEHYKETITITFGEVAENHVGQQKIGETNDIRHGLKLEQLQAISRGFGSSAELIDLRNYLPESFREQAGEAYFLVVRNGFEILLDESPDKILEEHMLLEKDAKYFDIRRQRVLNKRARHNLCFDDVDQEADYENKKGTIVSFQRVPYTKKLREELAEMIDIPINILKAEGNYYYDVSKCGIGFHGDTERRIVMALRLGHSMPLHYQWFLRGNSLGRRCELELNHGDIYFMSEKAVGTDWRKRSILTLRHAAGAKKYLTIKEK